MRPRRWLVCLVLALVSCSGAGSEDATASSVEEAPSTTDAATSSTTPTSTTETASPTSTTNDPAGPLAPDFSLELGEGGVYTLSEGAKPVYLVFWAEW